MSHGFRQGFSRLSLAASLIIAAGCATRAPLPSTAPSTVPAAARQKSLESPTASPAPSATSDASAEPLPSPVSLGLAALPDAAFVHWQDGDITSGRLVLRDAAGTRAGLETVLDAINDRAPLRALALTPTFAGCATMRLSVDGPESVLVEPVASDHQDCASGDPARLGSMRYEF